MHDIFKSECLSNSPGMPLCQTVAGLGPLERAASQICLQVSPTDSIPSKKERLGRKKESNGWVAHSGFFDQWLLCFFFPHREGAQAGGGCLGGGWTGGTDCKEVPHGLHVWCRDDLVSGQYCYSTFVLQPKPVSVWVTQADVCPCWLLYYIAWQTK